MIKHDAGAVGVVKIDGCICNIKLNFFFLHFIFYRQPSYATNQLIDTGTLHTLEKLTVIVESTNIKRKNE